MAERRDLSDAVAHTVMFYVDSNFANLTVHTCTSDVHPNFQYSVRDAVRVRAFLAGCGAVRTQAGTLGCLPLLEDLNVSLSYTDSC